MRFSRISITKRGVDLMREEHVGDGRQEVHLFDPTAPLPSFSDALAAFKPYVIDLLGIPEAWQESLSITTLNLSNDKNGLRGLVVTAIRPVPKAYDKPLVLSTPLVREGGENPSADAFVLTDAVLDLIELAETEAARYVRGDRLQLELMGAGGTGDTTNVDNFNQRAAEAEVSSTRKPRRGKKPRDFIPGVGDVVNADDTQVPSNETLRKLLHAAGRDVPVDAIAGWSSSERDAAQHWADAKTDPTVRDGDIPDEPLCVHAAATPDFGEGWTQPPVHVTDDAQQEIKAAAEHG